MIRRTVTLSPEAERDLLSIYEWIVGNAGAMTALAYVERVETYLQGFDLASERGTRRDDIRPGLRVVGFERSLTIAFDVDVETITILRLFRRGRNWTRETV